MKPNRRGKWSRSLSSPSPPLLKRRKNATCLCIPSLFQLFTLKHPQSIHLNVNEYYFQFPHSTCFFWLNPSKNTAKFKFIFFLTEILLKFRKSNFCLRVRIDIFSTGIWLFLKSYNCEKSYHKLQTYKLKPSIYYSPEVTDGIKYNHTIHDPKLLYLRLRP